MSADTEPLLLSMEGSPTPDDLNFLPDVIFFLGKVTTAKLEWYNVQASTHMSTYFGVYCTYIHTYILCGGSIDISYENLLL